MTDSATATGEWSDNNNESDLEGDEEPLFADDLEDIPPLPPPMSPLSEQRGQSSYTGSGDHVADGGIDPAAGKETSSEQDPPQKKKKKLLTLTTERIFSEKGLPYIEAEFPKLKFKGKRHEVADLKHLLQHYEHWANRMYPKLTFRDVMKRIERLSTTREFKMQLTSMRSRHARGGGVSPPLVDTDSEPEHQQEQVFLDHTSTGGHVQTTGASPGRSMEIEDLNRVLEDMEAVTEDIESTMEEVEPKMDKEVTEDQDHPVDRLPHSASPQSSPATNHSSLESGDHTHDNLPLSQSTRESPQVSEGEGSL